MYIMSEERRIGSRSTNRAKNDNSKATRSQTSHDDSLVLAGTLMPDRHEGLLPAEGGLSGQPRKPKMPILSSS